jgi:hypothetical protein
MKVLVTMFAAALWLAACAPMPPESPGIGEMCRVGPSGLMECYDRR